MLFRSLLDGVTELLDAGTVYYTAVQTIIPLAATSETMFTRFYERLVRRAGDPPASTFLLGFDSAPIRAEQSLYDLAAWTRTHPVLTEAVRTASPDATVAAIDADTPPAGVDAPTWQEWCDRFGQHLARHGHTVYNLDFAVPVPADDPAPLLGTLRFYLDGGGTDPAQRRQGAAQRRAPLPLAGLGPPAVEVEPHRADHRCRVVRRDRDREVEVVDGVPV